MQYCYLNIQSIFKFCQLFQYCPIIVIFFSSPVSSRELCIDFSYRLGDFFWNDMLFLDINLFYREIFSVPLQNKHLLFIYMMFFCLFSYHKEQLYMYPVSGVQNLIKLILVLSKTSNPGKRKGKVCLFLVLIYSVDLLLTL